MRSKRWFAHYPVSLITKAALACAICAASACEAQTQPADSSPKPETPAPASYSGCVQKAAGSNDTYVINTAKACALLKGKFVGADIAGHEIDLTGTLTPKSSTAAAAIDVQSVDKVGKSCTEVCSIRRTRSLQNNKQNEIPGSEGGTPGITTHPPH